MARKLRKLTRLEIVFILAALVMVGFLQFDIVNSPVIQANPGSVTVVPNTKHASDNTGDTLSGIIGDDATSNPDALSKVVTTDNVYTVDQTMRMYLGSFNVIAIPDGSTINAAVLHLQYGAEDGYLGTNPVRYDNSFGLTTTGITPTDITGWSADLTFNLYAAGVDTKAEIENVDIEFLNNDADVPPDAIHFDYVWIVVTYTPPVIPKSVSQSITITSGVTVTSTGARSVSQGITISDAVTAVVGKERSVSQDVTISDAVATTSERGKNIIQPLSITATTSAEASFSRSVSQGITVSDAVTAVASKERSVSQGMTISDAVATTSERVRNISQPLSITATTSAEASFSRSVSQDITISDEVTTASGEVRSVSQGITMSDAVATATERGRTINQGITITATTSTEASCCKSVSQSITISDAVTAVVAKERSVSQGITMSDAVATASGEGRSVSQGITISDAVATASGEGRTISQGITMSDAVTADVTVAPPTGGEFGPSPKSYVEADMFGTIKEIPIGDDGKILKAMEATSEDGMLTVTIPWGVVVLDEDGNPPSTLTVEVDATPPPLPEGGAIIGLAYDFEPAGVTFEPSITFTWSYDPDILPAGIAEEDLTLAYYDDDAGEWLELLCTVDTITNTITASVSHFTSFAIITRAPAVLPTAPAAFALSNLSVQPAEVQPEESVTITVSVVNTGGMEGSYTVVLNIKGVKEAEKSITLAGGNYRSVSFDVSREDAGSYSVVVDGLSGSFTVVAPPPAAPAPPPVAITRPLINWPLVGGITAAAVILGLFISSLRRRITGLLAYRVLPKFRSFAAILAAGGPKLALFSRRITSLMAHRVRPKFRSFAAIMAAGGPKLAVFSRRITSLLACRVLPKFRSFAAILAAGGSKLALLSRRITIYIVRRIKR